MTDAAQSLRAVLTPTTASERLGLGARLSALPVEHAVVTSRVLAGDNTAIRILQTLLFNDGTSGQAGYSLRHEAGSLDAEVSHTCFLLFVCAQLGRRSIHYHSNHDHWQSLLFRVDTVVGVACFLSQGCDVYIVLTIKMLSAVPSCTINNCAMCTVIFHSTSSNHVPPSSLVLET